MYPVYANIKYMSHGDSLIPGYSTCDPASHKRSEKVVEDGSNPWVPLTLAGDGEEAPAFGLAQLQLLQTFEK